MSPGSANLSPTAQTCASSAKREHFSPSSSPHASRDHRHDLTWIRCQDRAVPSYELVAALGNFFAAGLVSSLSLNAAAMRSARNYPHLLAERLGARLVDLTVSGATTANLLDSPQQTISGAVIPPQLEGVPAAADVVTITVGGNDLGFIAGLLFVAWSRVDPASPILTMLRGCGPRCPCRSHGCCAGGRDGMGSAVLSQKRKVAWRSHLPGRLPPPARRWVCHRHALRRR